MKHISLFLVIVILLSVFIFGCGKQIAKEGPAEVKTDESPETVEKKTELEPLFPPIR